MSGACDATTAAADIRAHLDKGLPHEARRDSVARLIAVYRELNLAAAAPKED